MPCPSTQRQSSSSVPCPTPATSLHTDTGSHLYLLTFLYTSTSLINHFTLVSGCFSMDIKWTTYCSDVIKFYDLALFPALPFFLGHFFMVCVVQYIANFLPWLSTDRNLCACICRGMLTHVSDTDFCSVFSPVHLHTLHTDTQLQNSPAWEIFGLLQSIQVYNLVRAKLAIHSPPNRLFCRAPFAHTTLLLSRWAGHWGSGGWAPSGWLSI